MNGAPLAQMPRAIFREGEAAPDVFRVAAIISRDDSRVESYPFDSLPAKRAALAIALAEMQNVFVSLRPESRYIFFKASPAPYQRGPGGGAGWSEGERRADREREGGREGRREEMRGREKESERERESPHMKPLSAPIQQYFYIYYPSPCASTTPTLPAVPLTPSTAVALNLKAAT